MDRYGINYWELLLTLLLLLLSSTWHSLLLRLRLRCTYNYQNLYHSLWYYRVLRTIQNPFFVGALVATSIHTAVMYDAPWHLERLNVWYVLKVIWQWPYKLFNFNLYKIPHRTFCNPIPIPSTYTIHSKFLQRNFFTKCHPLTLTPCFKKSQITWLDLSFYDDCLPTPTAMSPRALQQAVREDLRE